MAQRCLRILLCLAICVGNPLTAKAFTSSAGAALGVRIYLNPNTGRFWTMDSYEGSNQDPLSLHKYLYCQNNPVMGIDPSGLYLEFRGVEDRPDYNAATNYLYKSATARTVIDHLVNSKISYTIQPEGSVLLAPGEAALGDEYNWKTRVIYWAPRVGTRWKDSILSPKRSISPALILLHELGHAYHDDVNHDEFLNKLNEFTDSDEAFRWTNPEEKRTIIEIENKAARELGESVRDWHNPAYARQHSKYITRSSISTVAADIQTILGSFYTQLIN
jgi:RHS repeat-associated protein